MSTDKGEPELVVDLKTVTSQLLFLNLRPLKQTYQKKKSLSLRKIHTANAQILLAEEILSLGGCRAECCFLEVNAVNSSPSCNLDTQPSFYP